jgi:hypothetical protein
VWAELDLRPCWSKAADCTGPSPSSDDDSRSASHIIFFLLHKQNVHHRMHNSCWVASETSLEAPALCCGVRPAAARSHCCFIGPLDGARVPPDKFVALSVLSCFCQVIGRWRLYGCSVVGSCLSTAHPVAVPVVGETAQVPGDAWLMLITRDGCGM